MASQKQIEEIYDVFSEALREDLGEHFDYTCAFYNGNFSQTLEQAQRTKHDYILQGINFRKDMRVLDIGCGWGPMLKAIQERGGKAVGITLSSDQVKVCKQANFEAYLKDWKQMSPKEFGTLDAIVSVGAFEHFCSVEEYLSGEQNRIYKDFFKLCFNILSRGGRVYLQTSVWSKKVPSYKNVSLKAPKDSTEYLMALLGKFFPGSYPPLGKEQVLKSAEGFRLVSLNTNSADYLKTTEEWTARGRRITLRKIWKVMKLLPRYIIDRDFRYQIECVRRASFSTMYKRGVMYLVRVVFEKD